MRTFEQFWASAHCIGGYNGVCTKDGGFRSILGVFHWRCEVLNPGSWIPSVRHESEGKHNLGIKHLDSSSDCTIELCI